MELLSSIQHPNLVQCLGYCTNPNSIVMDYFPDNLHDYIQKQGKLDLGDQINFAYDIAQGMRKALLLLLLSLLPAMFTLDLTRLPLSHLTSSLTSSRLPA